MRSMCGADAGCLAINYQSLKKLSYRWENIIEIEDKDCGCLAHKKTLPPL